MQIRKFLPIIALLLFASCSNETPATAEFKNWISRVDISEGSAFQIWKDDETGCQYILYNIHTSGLSKAGLTPRLKSDGTPMCK